MQSYTHGTTPYDVIIEAHARVTPLGYTIVARGIDSVTLDAAQHGDGTFDAHGLATLLDALDGIEEGAASQVLADTGEADRYTAEEIVDNAMSLRTSILETLGIEEI
jgi:hypothetical protein